MLRTILKHTTVIQYTLKALWHSGKSSMTLLISLKSGTIKTQGPIKWINDKAKNKSTAMKKQTHTICTMQKLTQLQYGKLL